MADLWHIARTLLRTELEGIFNDLLFWPSGRRLTRKALFVNQSAGRRRAVILVTKRRIVWATC